MLYKEWDVEVVGSCINICKEKLCRGLVIGKYGFDEKNNWIIKKWVVKLVVVKK